MTKATTTPSREGTHILPLQMIFAFNGMGIALWFPRIPDVKADLEISLFALSICFFMLPFGTMIGFLGAAKVVKRLGTKRSCAWVNAGFLIGFILPALAWNAVTLGIALFITGLSVASVEVGMNTKANEIEADTGRRYMTRCHAFWSFGSMAGALVGGAFAQADISFLTQQLLVEPALAVGTIWFALQLPDDQKSDGPQSGGMALPSKAILALCLLPMGASLIEGAIMEWSALFLRDDIGIAPWAAAATYSGFALSMGIGRMLGDGLADRYQTRTIIVVSSLLSAVGIFFFSLSPGFWLALPTACLLGLGIANIYPLTLSIVGKSSGDPATNVAAMTFVAFMAFLIGPPLIGSLGSLIGLPLALTCLTPIAIYPLIGIYTGKISIPEGRA